MSMFGRKSTASKLTPTAREIASSAACEGYLYSKGTSGWKKRYFVLAENILYQYKDYKDKSPVGTITLPGFSVVAGDTNDDLYVFKVTHPTQKPFLMRASSKDEVARWTSHIRSACEFTGAVKNPAVSSLQADEDSGGTDNGSEGGAGGEASSSSTTTTTTATAGPAALTVSPSGSGSGGPGSPAAGKGAASAGSGTGSTGAAAGGGAAGGGGGGSSGGTVVSPLRMAAGLGTSGSNLNSFVGGSGGLASLSSGGPSSSTSPSTSGGGGGGGGGGALAAYGFVESGPGPAVADTVDEKVGQSNVSLCLIGRECGKSCLVVRLLHDEFMEEEDPTIVDTYSHVIDVDSHRVALQIIDVSGNDEYRAIRLENYPKGDAFLLCFSIIDRLSFTALADLAHEIRTTLAPNGRPSMVLVGTKADLVGHRVVSSAEAQAFADLLDMPYIECSAERNFNVREAFHLGVRHLNAQRRVRWSESPRWLDSPVRGLTVPPTSAILEYGPALKDGLPVVVSGTLSGLVAAMANDLYIDMEYVQTILLTHTLFTTSQDLLTALIARYTTPAPMADHLKMTKESALLLRARVLRIIRWWISLRRTRVFVANPPLVDQLSAFVPTVITDLGAVRATAFTSVVDDLKLEIAKQGGESAGEGNRGEEDGDGPRTVSLPPIFPKVGGTADAWGSLAFPEMDVVRAAQAITMIDADLLKRIEAEEMFSGKWSHARKNELAPNVVNVTQRFNALSSWVTFEVVKEFRLEARAALVRKFIDLATRLSKYRNHASAMAVLLGIQSSPTRRLKKTWALVQEPYTGMLAALNNTYSVKGQYANLKALLTEGHKAAIPYLGIFLNDLVYILDGNANTLDNGHINVYKLLQLNRTASTIMGFQGRSYAIEEHPQYLNFFSAVDGIDNTAAYSLSLRMEPPATAAAAEEEVSTGESLLLRSTVPLLLKYVRSLEVRLGPECPGMDGSLVHALAALAPRLPAVEDVKIEALVSALEGGSDPSLSHSTSTSHMGGGIADGGSGSGGAGGAGGAGGGGGGGGAEGTAEDISDGEFFENLDGEADGGRGKGPVEGDGDDGEDGEETPPHNPMMPAALWS